MLPKGGEPSPQESPTLPSQRTEGDRSADQEGEENSALRCEQASYPCSYAEADPLILEESARLAEEGGEYLAESGDMDALARWLEAQTEIAHLVFDDRALRFRLPDGPGFWIINPEAYPREALPSFDQEDAQIGKPLLMPRPQDSGPTGPVGEDTPGVEPRKKALILGPYSWEFQQNETPAVAEAIRAHRNYECPDCVETIIYASKKSSVNRDGDGIKETFGMSARAFLGWEEYDLIHVSTHGVQICDNDGGCYAQLSTGRFIKGSPLEFTKTDFGLPGVEWAHISGSGLWEQSINTDFFLFHYPGGLDDKIIFLSACQTAKGDDLLQTLGGQNTAVLGWTESVLSGPAKQISEQFYQTLIQEGYRAKITYDKIGSMDRLRAIFSTARADLVYHGDFQPRGREVITWLHPVYRDELQKIGHTPVDGIPGDGTRDEMLLLLQLEGIDESQNPADFTAHIKINDKEIDQDLMITKQVDDTSYWIETRVPLPADSNDIPTAKLEAWVDLAEGGKSRHVLEEVEMADCGWRGTIQGDESRDVSGKEVLDLRNAGDLDPGLQQQLQEEGNLPPESLLSGFGLGALDSSKLYLFMSGAEGAPFLFATEMGIGSLITDPPFGYSATELQINLTKDDGKIMEGTVQGPMLAGGSAPRRVDLAANFEWHVGSLCSFPIKAQLMQNMALDAQQSEE